MTRSVAVDISSSSRGQHIQQEKDAITMKQLATIRVKGIVQGVGFRPFVYRLARDHHLAGWVCNTSGAVDIEAEGNKEDLQRFLDCFEDSAPPRARIDNIDVDFREPSGYNEFKIKHSKTRSGEYQLVSPDIATCSDCQREILSNADRRHRYPFTNCTNCGPRFTIIKDIPYDRPVTTMEEFRMCPQCQGEYDNPLDRRFHAQPNACPDCGPTVRLVNKEKRTVATNDPIGKTAQLLEQGFILAIKGLGGFHLVCDATNKAAVSKIRQRKHRRSKPFGVMMKSLLQVRDHCSVSKEEATILTSPECPIVLLRWKQESSNVADTVAPALKYLGVMLPYTPLHHLLLHDVDRPLVATSGNISGKPLTKDNSEALDQLADIADYFLLHNRKIHVRCDDSVTMIEGNLQVLRRARGYAPDPIRLKHQFPQVLGCGAELKNTFCLTKDSNAFLSQHIGDMNDERTFNHYQEAINHYKELFRIEPEIVAHDLHPDYTSTRYALQLAAEQDLPLVAIQHHHAHVVSCMVDNNVSGPVIGVVFDGTGYGTDGTIWGGEFLLADQHHYERLAHLEQVPLPGGEAAIRNPYRMALSYLHSTFGDNLELDGLPLATINSTEYAVIKKQLEQRINAPLTSSAGRLFDAVAALIGIRNIIDYDAQAAIELEMLATGTKPSAHCYPFALQGQVVELAPLFTNIVKDIRENVSPTVISSRFHNTISKMIATVCRAIATSRDVSHVALTGGVFQNRLLLALTKDALRNDRFKVLTHNQVPTNDAGVSVGQAVIAGSIFRQE